MPCATCGKPGHNARSCTKTKTKAPTGGGTAPKPVKPPEVVAMTNGNLLGHVRQLVADVERGKAAERELAELRKALG